MIKQMSPQMLVIDIERSLQFYIEVLGFQLDFRYGDFYAGIVMQHFSIHLKKGKRTAAEIENRKYNEDLDILFSVEDIENVHEEFVKKSMNFIQPLRIMPYGKEFYISDPDGNTIGFIE